jgi:hypothetical protein
MSFFIILIVKKAVAAPRAPIREIKLPTILSDEE